MNLGVAKFKGFPNSFPFEIWKLIKPIGKKKLKPKPKL